MRLRKIIFWTGIVCSLNLVAAPPTGRYKAAVDRLNLIQSQHSKFSEVFSIGPNDDGVELYAMRISTTPEKVDPEKIGQIIVATHHGDEPHSTTLALAFIQDLLSRYESEELWHGDLAQMEWTIIPVLNVSGYNANRRQERGIDPNRDYPNPCLSGAGGKLKSISTLMNFMKTRSFTGAVTVHGYAGGLSFPWGVFSSDHKSQDHSLYQQIFKTAASFNGYRYGTSADVIYPANGTYEDFVYWKYGSWSMLVELRSGNSSDIANTVKSLASFFDQLQASPSNQHDFTSRCTHSRGLDLFLE